MSLPPSKLDVDPQPIEEKQEEGLVLIEVDRPDQEPTKTSYSKTMSRTKGAAYYQTLESDNKPNRALLTEKELKEAHPNCYDGLKDPLLEDEKRTLHDNYRRDGTTKRALDFLGEFTLGERTDLTMRPTKAYATQDLEDQQTAALMSDPDNVELLNELAQIDEDCNLNDNLNALFCSGRHFGRSVLVIQRDQDGIPVRLIPLASIRLGKVYVDSETWALYGIQYKDYNSDRQIVQTKDIIHYEANDYHITPNSRYFGLSDSESLIHIATSLRLTNEVSIPEVRAQNWAPIDIIQVGDVKTQQKLEEYKAMLKPGKRIVIGKGDLKHTPINTTADLDKIHNSTEASAKDILRAYGVPLVIAFQDEQNRATAAMALNQMKVSVLEKMRTTVRNVMEPQWYIPNLKAIIRRRQKRQGLQPPTTEGEEEGIITALERSARILQLQTDQVVLPFKPKMTFTDKSVDTFLEKSAALLGWLQAGGLTIPQALENIGLDKEAQEQRAEIEKKKLQTQATLTPTMPQQDTQQEGEPTATPSVPNFPISKNAPSSLGASSSIVSIASKEELEELEIRTKLKAASNEKLKEDIGLQIKQALRELQENR